MKGKIVINYYSKSYKLNKYWAGGSIDYYVKELDPILEYEESVYEGDINMLTDIDREFNSISVKEKDYKIYTVESVIPSTDGTITYYLWGGYIKEEESEELRKQLVLEGEKWKQGENDKRIQEEYGMLTTYRESKFTYKIAKLVKNLNLFK